MYLLIETIMNGTVTMQIIPTGIDAQTFEDAIIKIKNLPNFSKAIVHKEDVLEFTYSINGRCYGRVENKSLKII